MNNCKIIHESQLGAILDMIAGLKDLTDEDVRQKRPMAGKSSIARAASNMTLVFPVICSRGISIESASMVSKAVEKNAVSMLQKLLSAYNISTETDLVSYIQQFHKNISTKSVDLDDIFRLAEGASEPLTAMEEMAIREDMRNLDYYLPDPINESALTRFTVHEGAVDENDPVWDISKWERYRDYQENRDRAKRRDERERERDKREKERDQRDKERRERDDREHDEDRAYELANRDRRDKIDAAKDGVRLAKDHADYFNKQVLDSDFKKANELMPTNMAVNFTVITSDGQKIEKYESAVIGVKAKLYPVGSSDVVNHIVEKTTDRNWLTNLFRASTRETSFLKDFVLALDKAKIDAMSMSTRNSSSDRMWKVLERRATCSRLNRIMRTNNGASAITTLCVSQEEVEYLRKYHNIDMERTAVIAGLFDSLNLMCVCIVDETLEVTKFIFDEAEPMWETISFTHLEREASDGAYKKAINLMTKTSR